MFLLIPPKIFLFLIPQLPNPSAIMAVDDFQIKTDAFLSWLSQMGIRMSPKMELKDLRSESRGRGVGKSVVLVLEHAAPTTVMELCHLSLRISCFVPISTICRPSI
jgi:hypothetical protein